MPFYLLILEEMDTETMEKFSFVLLQSPNGTPLCCVPAIRTPELLERGLRIYWLDEVFATPQRIEKISSMKEVKEFRKLSEITVGIYDREWLWEDEYINRVFANVIDLSKEEEKYGTKMKQLRQQLNTQIKYVAVPKGTALYKRSFQHIYNIPTHYCT